MSYWRFPTSIFIDYSIQEVIRSSGLSKVYRAQNRHDGQLVAIKVLKLTPGLDQKKAERKIMRFQREATLCVVVDHPHIIKLLDYVHEPWHAPYAVYEYASGVTLKELIWQEGGLTGKMTAAIMGQVLGALKASHDSGVVHRDLKPENIMVNLTDDQVEVKLLDFGIGTWSEPDEVPGYKPLTFPNEFLGTPAYAAPEQLIGQKPNAKIDLYAWGLILFECLTGKPAISGHSLNEVVCRQLAGDTVRMPRWMDEHPVADLLEKVLTRSPVARMANVQRIYNHFRQLDLSDLGQQTGAERTHGSPSGQEITITHDLAQHQDLNNEIMTVVCLRFEITKKKDCPLSDHELEDLRIKEYHWLTRFVKAHDGRVVSVLAHTFMLTFNQTELGEEHLLKATDTLLQLFRHIPQRFGNLETQYQLHVRISAGMNSGNTLVEYESNPRGIIPNIALDLMTKAEEGQLIVSEACREPLVSQYHLTPLIPDLPEGESPELNAYLVASPTAYFTV